MIKNNKIFQLIENVLIVKMKESINILLLILFGRKWKIILINEYPKCGGSWLKRMIGDALLSKGYNYHVNKKGIPFIKEKNIIHRHWLKYTEYAYKTVIIVRDPRDVYNSFYFHENYFQTTNKKKKIFGFDDVRTDRENMYSYIKSKLLYPELTTPGFSYKVFWETFKSNKDIYIVKYEDLRNNTEKELKNIFDYLEASIDESQIVETIKKFDFENMKKQQENSDNRKNHVRKGVVGDWENNFEENTVELFKKYYSDMLIDMKYKIIDI
jgi:hypothetical protein